MEWVTLAATFLAGVVSAVFIYDRILKHRSRIGREFSFVVATPTRTDTPTWEPAIVDDSQADTISIGVKLYNNSGEPIEVRGLEISRIPIAGDRPSLISGAVKPHAAYEGYVSFTPDWHEWNQSVQRGMSSRAPAEFRCSLSIWLSASSKRLTIRSPKYSIPVEIMEKNAHKAIQNS